MLVNCDKLGIGIYNVIAKAATKNVKQRDITKMLQINQNEI